MVIWTYLYMCACEWLMGVKSLAPTFEGQSINAGEIHLNILNHHSTIINECVCIRSEANMVADALTNL